MIVRINGKPVEYEQQLFAIEQQNFEVVIKLAKATIVIAVLAICINELFPELGDQITDLSKSIVLTPTSNPIPVIFK